MTRRTSHRTATHHRRATGRAVRRATGRVAGRTLTLVIAGCCLAACSHQEADGAAPRPPAATGSPGTPAVASPTLPPPPPPSFADSDSTVPAFAEDTAVSCAGQPSADQVTGKVRAAGLLSSGTRVTVALGPVCAGDWQYTVFTMPGREPLQIVTEGQPTALTVVTAGTDVCSTKVLSNAPIGIINVTGCGVGVPPPA